MAVSKRKKQIKQKETPKGRSIAQGGNPEQFYTKTPVWSFSSSDQEKWPFTKEHIGDLIWEEILPRLKALETQTWSEILVKDKKQNHAINVYDLNKTAQERLEEKYIEAEALISLRITGIHRLYGYMEGNVFHVLWYDKKHGDNETCVCRAYKKHT